MTKYVKATLPRGTLVYPKLNEVDEFKGKRRFITRIKFNDDDHRKVDAWLKKAAKELGAPDGVKLPWKKDKKTGEICLEAKSGEDKPPMLTDAKGKEVPRAKVKVGGGTTAKVDVSANYYDGFGGGINLYINFVQIIELKKKGFDIKAEEGFSYEDEEDEDQGPAEAPKSPSHDLDDDIPF
ncbi:hypothetical protein [Bradyrhizobium sp. BR 10289]|uniref:hypothetical protein n=1 Tax=Bradyrhizobium sp. BR 10289 TaxID=2749993 RepID=UPI001C64EC6A|nr:hypothetical protein [Bradyrhizobium sp. BR 10289]MBW7970983.1 hypothetical protein [Bradyrhizobium sp. BR 10289]